MGQRTKETFHPQILILCASLCLLAVCVCVSPSLQGPLYLFPSFSLLLLLSSFICFSGLFLALQVSADAGGRERERAGEGKGGESIPSELDRIMYYCNKAFFLIL